MLLAVPIIHSVILVQMTIWRATEALIAIAVDNHLGFCGHYSGIQSTTYPPNVSGNEKGFQL